MNDPEAHGGYRVILAAAVFGGLGVVAGAFGAHALDGRVSEARLAAFETGVRYHLYHALALLAVGVLMTRRSVRGLTPAAVAFAAGIVLFSGSLYLLVLLDATPFAMVTPFGGVTLIVGWGLVAWAAVRELRSGDGALKSTG